VSIFTTKTSQLAQRKILEQVARLSPMKKRHAVSASGAADSRAAVASRWTGGYVLPTIGRKLNCQLMGRCAVISMNHSVLHHVTRRQSAANV
jgi:hypothetical protein